MADRDRHQRERRLDLDELQRRAQKIERKYTKIVEKNEAAMRAAAEQEQAGFAPAGPALKPAKASQASSDGYGKSSALHYSRLISALSN